MLDGKSKDKRVSKIGLKAIKWDINKPAWGCQPAKYSRKTPSLAKMKDMEGCSCLINTKSTINGV